MPEARPESASITGSSYDLLAAGVFATATLVVTVLPEFVPDVGRIVVAAPLLLFFSGYVALASLFPESAETVEWGESLPPAERIVLSIGLSIVLTPVITLFVFYSPLPFTQRVIVAAIAGTTLVAAAIAAFVRSRTAPERRLTFDPVGWAHRGYAAGWRSAPRGDRVLNVAVVASLVFCTAAVGFGVSANTHSDPFTTFTMKTQENGDLVARNYPTELEPGENRSVSLLVGNHEGHRQTYTIVVQRRPLAQTGNASAGEVLTRKRVQTLANGTKVVKHRLAGSVVEGPTRITYLLYKGEPDRPLSERTAYRSLSLRINATAANTASDRQNR